MTNKIPPAKDWNLGNAIQTHRVKRPRRKRDGPQYPFNLAIKLTVKDRKVQL